MFFFFWVRKRCSDSFCVLEIEYIWDCCSGLVIGDFEVFRDVFRDVFRGFCERIVVVLVVLCLSYVVWLSRWC